MDKNKRRIASACFFSLLLQLLRPSGDPILHPQRYNSANASVWAQASRTKAISSAGRCITSNLLAGEFGVIPFSAVYPKVYGDIGWEGVRTHKAQIDRFRARLIEYYCSGYGSR